MDWNARCFRVHPPVDVGNAFAVRGLSKLKLPEESQTRYFNTYKGFLNNKPQYDVPSNLSPEKIWYPTALSSVRFIVCHQANETTVCIINEQSVIIKEFEVNFGYDFKIQVWKDHIFAWGEGEEWLEDPMIIYKLEYNVEELAQAAKANTSDDIKHCKLKLAKNSIPRASPLSRMTAVFSMKSFGDYLWLMRVSSSIFVFHAPTNDLSQLQFVKYMDCYGNQLDISCWKEEALFPEEDEEEVDPQEFPLSKIWKFDQYAITFSNYMFIWDASTGKRLAQFETERISTLTKLCGKVFSRNFLT